MRSFPRKGFFIPLALLSIVLISLCAYRIIALNTASPEHERIVYNLGEEVAPPMFNKMESQPTDSGARVTATGCSIEENQAIKGRFPGFDESKGETSNLGEPRYLVAEVTFRNDGKTDLNIPIGGIVAQMGAWSNGLEMPLFTYMNEGADTVVKMVPGEEKLLLLPFSLYESQFGFSDTWKMLADREFELVLATYPNKVCINIGSPHAIEYLDGMQGEKR